MTRRQKRKSNLPKRRHVTASLTYIAPHHHTGKRLSHKHTSHGILFLILIFLGIVLFMALASLTAAGIGRQVQIGATVLGAPPVTGAKITTPLKKSKAKRALMSVQGSCPTDNVVAVYKNGVSAAATTCTNNAFAVTVQLSKGANTLQAQNYDALNQPGPATEQVEVAFEPDTEQEVAQPVVNEPTDIIIDEQIPTLPAPAPQPTEHPCYEEPIQTGEPLPTVGLLCVTRNIFVGERLELPIVIAGGIGPYALSVDWADDTDAELYSFEKPGRHVIGHTFAKITVRSISLKLVDGNGAAYQTQAVVSVNKNDATGTTDQENPIVEVAETFLLEASVPVYWTVLALFAGFWVGDIFQRLAGLKSPRRKRAHA
jgi:hypothetical protein